MRASASSDERGANEVCGRISDRVSGRLVISHMTALEHNLDQKNIPEVEKTPTTSP